MDKSSTITREFELIGAFKVHKSILVALTGWRPNYWKVLTFDTRNAIDTGTLALFNESLEAYSQEDVDGFHESYRQWIIHRCATNAHSGFWRSCLFELNKRKRAIQDQKRMPCGARKKTGQQCKAKAEIGSNRCRFHGGNSTGPKTIDGKIKSLANLPQYRHCPDLLIAKRRELEREMRRETGM